MAKRHMSAFHPKPPKALPIADKVWLTPSRVRPAHWTDAEVAALPAPVANPNLNKNRFMFMAPLAIPGVVGYGFFLLNNFTGIYNQRTAHLRPY